MTFSPLGINIFSGRRGAANIFQNNFWKILALFFGLSAQSLSLTLYYRSQMSVHKKQNMTEVIYDISTRINQTQVCALIALVQNRTIRILCVNFVFCAQRFHIYILRFALDTQIYLICWDFIWRNCLKEKKKKSQSIFEHRSPV